MSKHLDEALAALDAGMYELTVPIGGCWRCSAGSETSRDQPLTPLGLCGRCDEWLHSDLAYPPSPGAKLHPSINAIPATSSAKVPVEDRMPSWTTIWGIAEVSMPRVLP